MDFSFSSAVPAYYSGRQLIEYLVNRYTYHTEAQWKEFIEKGKILLNGQRCFYSSIVFTADRVTYFPEDFEEPPANLNYNIIYEDERLLGVNKPPNLLVHRSGRFFRSNLIYQIRYVRPGTDKEIYPINRLDRDTSGVVLMVKGRGLLSKFHGIFSERKIEKTYIAVVHNIPEQPTMVIDKPIGKKSDLKIPYKYCVDLQNGKEAVTRLELKQVIGSKYAVVILKPCTGRTHQLRVHLASIGCPIVGDKLYGWEESRYLKWLEKPHEFEDEITLNRQALHCFSIKFVNPVNSKPVEITAPIPADILETIEKLKTE